MEVICLQTRAFYELVETVVERVKTKNNVTQDKWITGVEAMKLLKIKSKTTLQNMRDRGDIVFTQPQRKLILYDRDSINEYLENNTRQTF